MKLREIFAHLLAEGGPYHRKQKELAERIGCTASSVSRIYSNAPEWEEHFNCIKEVLKLCRELGIDPLSDDAPARLSSALRLELAKKKTA